MSRINLEQEINLKMTLMQSDIIIKELRYRKEKLEDDFKKETNKTYKATIETDIKRLKEIIELIENQSK